MLNIELFIALLTINSIVPTNYFGMRQRKSKAAVQNCGLQRRQMLFFVEAVNLRKWMTIVWG